MCSASACAIDLICNKVGRCLVPAKEIHIVGNRAGGTFAIKVPDGMGTVGIALISYDPMTVTLSGATDRVVAVLYAGHTGATVRGIDPRKVISLRDPALATDALPNTISSDEDSTIPPSKIDVEKYVTSILGGGTLFSHACQRDAGQVTCRP